MLGIQLTKRYAKEFGFKILTEEANYIVFKYQMNSIHVWSKDDDEHFIMITLPNFDEVTEGRINEIKNRCYIINKEMKQIKLYVMDGIILAAAEIYFMDERDFTFQMERALNNLITAKFMYNNKTEFLGD